MTLFNPKPMIHFSKRKNFRICPRCKQPFSFDGRGHRVFCVPCQSEKHKIMADKAASYRYLKIKQEKSFCWFWSRIENE